MGEAFTFDADPLPVSAGAQEYGICVLSELSQNFFLGGTTLLNQDLLRNVTALKRCIDILHISLCSKKHQRHAMRDLQKLDQALHPLLDELLALFGGMGQVIAVVNEGMLIVKIGGGLWLRKHSGIS